MKYKPKGEEFQSLSGVNIIPVIDVSLVLLIILLATSPILNIPGFPIKLPKAVTADNKEKNITISVSPKGEYGINEAPVTLDTLGPALRQQLKNTKDIIVIIRADKDVAYGVVENVMDIAKRYGAQRVGIATQQDQAKEK